VRGQKAKGGAGLVMRVRICRMVLEPLLAEGQRMAKGLVKCSVERGRRWWSWNVGSRLTKVIVNGDDPLLEQQGDPRRGGLQPVRGRVVRVGGNRFVECSERFVVVKVVAKLESPRAQCSGGWRSAGRRGGRACADEQGANERSKSSPH